jgi:organic radical activating enzyme
MLRDKVRTTLTLKINEIYETVQGEGLLVGKPSLFIRLQGCNLRCPWCDQPGSLSQEGGKEITLKDLILRARRSPFRHAVITGGEPFTCSNLHLIVQSLIEEGFSVQIETNGTLFQDELLPLVEGVHITCSPKGVAGYFVHPSILKYASELKFVVDESLSEEVLLREEFISFHRRGLTVLQPESNKGEMFKKALRIQRNLSPMGFELRVIPQVHKFLGIP